MFSSNSLKRGPQILQAVSQHGHDPQIICFDGNISQEAMRAVLDYCNRKGITSEYSLNPVGQL